MRERRLCAVMTMAVVSLILGSGAARAAVQGFPAYVNLPAGVDIPAPGSLTVEDLGEAEFSLSEGKSITKQGKHYRSYLAFASGTNPGAAATWKQWLPGLTQAGFKVVGTNGSSTYTLQRTATGLESWLSVALADYNDPLLELIEIKAAQAPGLVLPKPAAKPETFGDKDDFPYLAHYPGTTLTQSALRTEPLDVTNPGSDSEAVLAGTGYKVKWYQAPSTLSRLQFAQTYRDALTQAGWTVKPAAPGTHPGEALIASYTQNGRNLWTVLSRADPGSDQGIQIAVADLGTEDWAGALDRSCRLPLYGVHFDFNKATLRPDSEPVLRQVAVLLQAKPGLSVEVQGHTDNVGGDDANLKLSDARAQAVAQWLTTHGIVAGRLTAKGYGKKVPVAPNDSDKNRALNRRVELKKQGCAK